MNTGLFILIPVIIWAAGITAVSMAVKSNFKRANSRPYRSQPDRQLGRSTFSKPQPTIMMSAQRPQVEKGLLDMNLNRKKQTDEKKTFSFGGFSRNTGYDTFETKGRKKDIVTGYDRKLTSSRTRMARTSGMQYSHTYDGHEPWDKCLPKEKDPWDPDFYS